MKMTCRQDPCACAVARALPTDALAWGRLPPSEHGLRCRWCRTGRGSQTLVVMLRRWPHPAAS